MLTDSSLTNILVVSGVSQIRYRVYNQDCNKDTLIGHLTATTTTKEFELTLLKAYKELISLHIPAVWRISDEAEEKNGITLELWVFWFDDRHTGKIDENDNLYALEETKVGSFTWENAYSKMHSPTASPVPVTSQPNSKLPVTVSEEYKWFMSAVRNLIHNQLKMSGAIPMGDVYICTQYQHDFSEELRCNSSSLLKLTSSVLCCFYNVYMASTNLIFQPNTRRIKIRPITAQTMNSRGKKVIIAPTGETAFIATHGQYSLSQQAEQTILERWAHFLDIPCSSLVNTISRQCPSQRALHSSFHTTEEHHKNQERLLPKLVAIKLSSGGDLFYYPTRLVFAPSSSKISPIAMAGTNGLFGFNQGFSEDLGDKWKRELWNEQITNYWDFANPDGATTSVIFETLSRENTNHTTASSHKSANDPQANIVASPHAGTNKTAATPGSNYQPMDTGSPSVKQEQNEDDGEELGKSSRKGSNKFNHANDMSLAEFAMAHFAMPYNDDLIDYPVTSVSSNNNNNNNNNTTANDASKTPSASLPDHENKMQHQTPIPMKAEHTVESTTAVNATSNGALPVESIAAAASTYQSPQLSNLDLDPFGMGNGLEVDNMVLDMPDRWGGDDGMGDLDNFDFGVTEEDFDFFAASGPAMISNAPTTATSMAASIAPTAAAAAAAAAPTAPLVMTTSDHVLMDPTSITNGLVAPESSLQPLEAVPNSTTTTTTAGTASFLEDVNMQMDMTQTPSNKEQSAMPFTAEMDIDQSNEISITPLQISMAEHDPFNMQTKLENSSPPPSATQDDPSYIHQAFYSHSSEDSSLLSPQPFLVPPQFAPVSFGSIVNDNKYTNGGKFTYSPPTDDKKQKQTRKKSKVYCPDYKPVTRKKTRNKKRDTTKRKTSGALSMDNLPKEERQPPFTIMKEGDGGNDGATMLEAATTATATKSMQLKPTDNDTIHIEQINSDSDTDSTTDTSSSSSENDDNDMDEDEEKSAFSLLDDESLSAPNDNLPLQPEDVERVMQSLSDVQVMFAAKLTKTMKEHRGLTDQEPSKDIKLTQITMDFDSPFARSVASGTVRPNDFEISLNNVDDLRALDYLCQQAVMGGYPFSGGIETMTSNGFNPSEGESAKVIVARRRTLLQKFYGDVIHVPSTPNDVDFMIQDFKVVLGSIFNQPRKTPSLENMNDMNIDSLPPLTTVAVKGPLNVQQYYELSETNQTHSKYGKYQVKKRRPAEPNFDILQPPDITVGRQDDFLKGSPKLITFWEKLRLEPYSAKKHINYFVVYPQNNSIENIVMQFFKGLSTMYETCLLGAHQPGNCGNYRKGLVPVPLLDGMDGNETFDNRQLRSYLAECLNLGSVLQSTTMTKDTHTVIYMINPFTHLSSNLDLSRCFNKLVDSFNAIEPGTITKEQPPSKLVLQLIPIEHILRSTSFGGCLKSGLKEIAFSVYAKCNTQVTRETRKNHRKLLSSVAMFTPPFILSKPNPTTIKYKVKNAITAFPTILDNNSVLHVGYALSFDKRWMILVWTDNSGEMIEFVILDQKGRELSLSALFEEAWTRTAQIAKRTGFNWTFVIVKLGLMFEKELAAWTACLPPEEKVAIISMDIESPLHLNPLSGLSPSASSDILNLNNNNNSSDPMTPGTPNMLSASSPIPNKNTNNTENYDYGQTKALLLNHRIAYSNKREQVSLGNVDINYYTAETWMIPLASGYMIHTSPITENPNNEIYNCNPLILEIHLVYNQTDHSAYSTLRDIVKTYHALSYINIMPSNNNRLPIHLTLVERLSRLLLVINP